MIINLSPVLTDTTLTVSVQGDVLTLNGVDLDFGPLPEGATLPQTAFNNEFLRGDVSRIDGQVNVTIMLPFASNPSPAVCFPEPITVTEDGPVELPT